MELVVETVLPEGTVILQERICKRHQATHYLSKVDSYANSTVIDNRYYYVFPLRHYQENLHIS